MSANAMSADPSAEVMLEAFQALGQYPDENLGPLVQRLVWALLAVSSVVMAMRFYVKLRETRRVYVDDWLMLLALVMGIGQGVVGHDIEGVGRGVAWLTDLYPSGHVRRH